MTFRDRERRTRAKDERGIVLVVVLLVVTLLTITVVEFTFSVALDAHRARHARDALQAELLARSGINIAGGLLTRDNEREFDSPLEEWWQEAQEICAGELELAPNMRVRCRIADESGRINVNLTCCGPHRAAGEPLKRHHVAREAIRCLFLQESVELADKESGDISDQLSEYWNTPVPGPDGEERRPPPFVTVEDFAATFGISPEDLRRVRPFLTAQPASALGRVNVNTAPPEVLNALITEIGDDAGFCEPNADAVENILARREEDPIPRSEINGLVGGQGAGIVNQLLGANSNLFRIETSAVVNFDPENPGDFGGVAETLSLLVQRKPAPKLAIPEENIPGWTLRPVDWQKEGGARLFLEPDGSDEEGKGNDEDEDFLPPLEEDR